MTFFKKRMSSLSWAIFKFFDTKFQLRKEPLTTPPFLKNPKPYVAYQFSKEKFKITAPFYTVHVYTHWYELHAQNKTLIHSVIQYKCFTLQLEICRHIPTFTCIYCICTCVLIHIKVNSTKMSILFLFPTSTIYMRYRKGTSILHCGRYLYLPPQV